MVAVDVGIGLGVPVGTGFFVGGGVVGKGTDVESSEEAMVANSIDGVSDGVAVEDSVVSGARDGSCVGTGVVNVVGSSVEVEVLEAITIGAVDVDIPADCNPGLELKGVSVGTDGGVLDVPSELRTYLNLERSLRFSTAHNL
jgi:hypothetical protein